MQKLTLKPNLTMKYFFTLMYILLCSNYMLAQCDELFFSEYVEGWSNNKALEIYNPTPLAIDLSAYEIVRYSNGDDQASTPQQLEGIIEPYSTFVVGLDKRDPDGIGYDAPMWDGWITDSITNEPIYLPDTDLQSRIDFWANGIYYSGTDPDSAAMYPMALFFNGNDAITLERIGLGVADLIGRVGENPGDAAGWADDEGNWWTKDHTLIRKPFISQGVSMNPTVFDPTLEWDSLPVNTFINLGSHECDCQNNSNLFETEPSFVIYPNPSHGEHVTINSISAINNIRVHNKLGQELLNINIADLNKTEITLPNKNDIYFISVKNRYGIKTKPIILH